MDKARARARGGFDPPTMDSMDNALEPRPQDDGSDLAADIAAALQQVAGMGREALKAGGAVVREAVDGRLTSRVAAAIERGDVGTTTQGLALALSPPASASLLHKGMQVATSKTFRKVLPLRLAARRTPMGMAIAVGPTLLAVVRSTVQEVDAIAGHLSSRAQMADIDPDPRRVTIATVQAVAGVHMNADGRIPYDRLARQWIKAGAVELVPWGNGRTNSDLADLVGRVADFDVTALEPRDG